MTPTSFGKYELLEKIAVGGMAEVFRARVRGAGGFEKHLAIKRILPHLSNDTEFVVMLIDEAKIAVSLNHPNIVQVYDLGKIDGTYFIAMEFIEGGDLKVVMRRCQELGLRLPIAHAVYITTEVLKGLEYAHQKMVGPKESPVPLHIIHRDISPPNILLSYEGEVKIVDFGIAKANTRMMETSAGILKGKFEYMSPEQASGLTVDARTDLFSTSILLYEMLTGKSPFGANADLQVLANVRAAKVTPPSRISPEIPKRLEQIIMRGLQRDPEDRFLRAGEMRAELTAFIYESGYTCNASRLATFMRDVFAEDVRAGRSATLATPEPPRKESLKPGTGGIHRPATPLTGAPASGSPEVGNPPPLQPAQAVGPSTPASAAQAARASDPRPSQPAPTPQVSAPFPHTQLLELAAALDNEEGPTIAGTPLQMFMAQAMPVPPSRATLPEPPPAMPARAGQPTGRQEPAQASQGGSAPASSPPPPRGAPATPAPASSGTANALPIRILEDDDVQTTIQTVQREEPGGPGVPTAAAARLTSPPRSGQPPASSGRALAGPGEAGEDLDLEEEASVILFTEGFNRAPMDVEAWKSRPETEQLKSLGGSLEPRDPGAASTLPLRPTSPSAFPLGEIPGSPARANAQPEHPPASSRSSGPQDRPMFGPDRPLLRPEQAPSHPDRLPPVGERPVFGLEPKPAPADRSPFSPDPLRQEARSGGMTDRPAGPERQAIEPWAGGFSALSSEAPTRIYPDVPAQSQPVAASPMRPAARADAPAMQPPGGAPAQPSGAQAGSTWPAGISNATTRPLQVLPAAPQGHMAQSHLPPAQGPQGMPQPHMPQAQMPQPQMPQPQMPYAPPPAQRPPGPPQPSGGSRPPVAGTPHAQDIPLQPARTQLEPRGRLRRAMPLLLGTLAGFTAGLLAGAFLAPQPTADTVAGAESDPSVMVAAEAGVETFLNDNLMGRDYPLTFTVPPDLDHRIRMVKPGNREYETTIRLGPGQRLQLSVPFLEPLPPDVAPENGK